MMMAHQREDLSLEDWMASITDEDMELMERGDAGKTQAPDIMEDDTENGTGGVVQPEPLIKMLRQNDPVLHHVDRSFLEYVEKMDDGRMTDEDMELMEREPLIKSNDTFWNHVQDMKDGRMKCQFCGHLFSRNTSISRIKWHLSGESGHGVKICEDVPQEVQEAAGAAIDGTPGRKRKTVSGSRNNEGTIAIDVNMNDRENETGEAAGCWRKFTPWRKIRMDFADDKLNSRICICNF
ncbi:hypothetical protein Peur_061941 [Populus x canadensis]